MSNAQRDQQVHIPSPYNFVPLSKEVVMPPWGGLVSHDVPFEDGISGWIEYEIKALTPIFSRGDDDRFFRTAKDEHAIPGTSIRGMLRNIVEIASFGRMERVDEGWYGIRDLHNRHTYGQYMAEIHLRRPTPLVNAGWLWERRNEEGEAQWFIQPCHYAKVEYGLFKQVEPSYDPNPKQSAVDKYFKWLGKMPPKNSREIESLTQEEWQQLEDEFKVSVEVLSKSGTQHQDGSVRISDYAKVATVGKPVRGQFVLTGQPADYDPHKEKKKGAGNPKHHDFLFYDKVGEEFEVTHLRERFEGAHRDTGQQGRMEIQPNPEWRFWRTRLRMGGRVPVFFLTKKGENETTVRAFGLAQMFRLAYDLSTLDLVQKVQCNTWKGPDLAELLFGYVRDERRFKTFEKSTFGTALRGRVSIGQAKLEGEAKQSKKIRAILAGPKPTFYPSYITQANEEGKRPGYAASAGSGGKDEKKMIAWSTYMEDPKHGAARPRGWKRYVARQAHDPNPKIPKDIKSEEVFTNLYPLEAGSTFKGRMRVHNLLPVELGALLFAMELGQVDGAQHSLGQGRPFGLGQVKMRILESHLSDLDDRTPDLDACRLEFAGFMHESVPGWANTPQMRELFALLRPIGDPAEEKQRFRYPDLKGPAGNEFVNAKKAGAVLPLHGGSSRPSPLEFSQKPERTWVEHGLGRTLHPTKGEEGDSESPSEASGQPELPELPLALTVKFKDWLKVRERRGIYAKQKKKGNVKDFSLDVEPTDPKLEKQLEGHRLIVSITQTQGVDEFMQAVAGSNPPLTVEAELPVELVDEVTSKPKARSEAKPSEVPVIIIRISKWA